MTARVIRFPVERARRPEPFADADWALLDAFADRCRADGVEATAARTGMWPETVALLIDSFGGYDDATVSDAQAAEFLAGPRRHLSAGR